MAEITRVEATDRHVLVTVGCWGRDDWFRVEARKDLDGMEPVALTWMSTNHRAIEAAQEFAVALDEAIGIALRMQSIIDTGSLRGDGLDVAYDFGDCCHPDWAVALYVLIGGGEVFYLRDGELRYVRDETSRVVDRSGLAREAAEMFEAKQQAEAV